MMLFRREVVIGLLFGHINLETIYGVQVQNYQHQRLRTHYEHEGDTLSHSDKDVTAYTDAIIKGSKFVEVDKTKGDLMKQEEENLRNPYFMAMDREEIIEAHKQALKEQKKVGEEKEESDIDLVDADEKLLQLGSHENPWDTMIQIEKMTDQVTKKNEIKEPVKTGPSPEDLAKKKAAEQAEKEKQAIDEARNELLAPEPINQQALQTGEAIKNAKKSGSELENDKMAEIIEDNKEYTEAPKKKSKDGRASITSALEKDSQQADDAVDVPVKVNDVLNQQDSDTQQEKNRKTMESLASAMGLDTQAEEAPQPPKEQPAPVATNQTVAQKADKAQQNTTKQANKTTNATAAPVPSSDAKVQTQTDDINTQPEAPITSLSSNANSVIEELQKEEAKQAQNDQQQTANITIVVPAPAPVAAAEPAQAPPAPAAEPLPTLAAQEVVPQVAQPALVQAPAPAAPQNKLDMNKFKQDVAKKLMAIKAQKNKAAAASQKPQVAAAPATPVPAPALSKPIATVKQGEFTIVKKKPPPVAQFMKSIEKKPALVQQIGKPAVQSEVVKPVAKIKTQPKAIAPKPVAAVAAPAPVVTQSVVQRAQSPISSAPSTQPNIAPKAQAAAGTASIGELTAAEALAALPPPPAPVVQPELSVAQKAAKEKLENPTVDENGQHIMTVEESRIEAKAMQQALDMGTAAVDAKIQAHRARDAELAAHPPPVVEEKDDGHVETVEEVKAKMAAAQQAMDAGMSQVNAQAAERQKQEAMMPDMGALATITGTIHSMSGSQNKRQAMLLASKLGVESQPDDEKLSPEVMTSTLIERASKAGKTSQEIEDALKD